MDSIPGLESVRLVQGKESCQMFRVLAREWFNCWTVESELGQGRKWTRKEW